MKGIILAAGKGTRLGLGCKPLVEVAGRPIIKYVLDNFTQLGITDVAIVYNDNALPSEIGRKHDDIALTYIKQSPLNGVSDAVFQARRAWPDDDVVIILGDVIYRGGDLFKFVEGRGNAVAYKANRPFREIYESYGFKIKDGRRVFYEKPEGMTDLTHDLGLGIYRVARDSLFRFHDGNITNTIAEIFDKDGGEFIELAGDYFNINTPLELKTATTLLERM